MELKNKEVLVVGFGRTGEALVQFLLSKNAKVKVSEIKKKEEMEEKIKEWLLKGVVFEFGEHKVETFLNSDLIVLSPGVPPLPQIEKAQKEGIEVISEVELAFHYLKGKIIGITGSNGKSTTTVLIYQILKETGLKAYLAGNIGFPLISYASSSLENGIFVAELSSFQLKYIKEFQPYIAIFLNITPDHLDWHPDFNDYYQSKKNLFLSQGPEDFAILNADDPKVWILKNELKAKVLPFSRKKKFGIGAYINNGNILIITDKSETQLDARNIILKGPHNQENIMASVLAASLLGVSEEIIKNVIYNFKGLEHRLEKVTEINGIEFYNDSKATNVDATLKSIQSFDKNIILILGGRDKHGDFTKLREEIKRRVKKLILIGEAREKIRKALEETVPFQYVQSLKEAVRVSFNSAKSGDIVLLAPACASFDMFENFEHRGKVFKQEVFKLKKLDNFEN
jgi:UDP-N-acetylmuramoylalanine--D-glutamate ligase